MSILHETYSLLGDSHACQMHVNSHRVMPSHILYRPIFRHNFLQDVKYFTQEFKSSYQHTLCNFKATWDFFFCLSFWHNTHIHRDIILSALICISSHIKSFTANFWKNNTVLFADTVDNFPFAFPYPALIMAGQVKADVSMRQLDV